MQILALDTSTELSTFAIVKEGVTLFEHAARVPAKHAETLLPSLERALALLGTSIAQMDLLAAGIGPGSFTGLRIGLSTIKGFALATGKPVVAVSSLRCIAAALEPRDEAIAVAVNAFKDEVYAALYLHGEVQLAPLHASPEEAGRALRTAAGDRRVVLVGDGATVYGERLTGGLGAYVRAASAHDAPRASVLAACAARELEAHGACDAAALLPDYVRGSDATLPLR